MSERGKFLHHESCPECGSSDALAVYTNNSHCFACGFHLNDNTPPWDDGETELADEHPVRHAKDRELTPLPQREQPAIKDRSICAGAVNKYKVTVNTNPDSPAGHVYPYFDENGAHVANKVRRKGEKAFYWEGDTKSATLFGQTMFPPGGKAVTVVEGECDALACFELTGSRYPCVSVKSASEAKRNVVDSFEYLNSFEKIVIAFDADDPGQKAANEVAQLFSPGKVHILKLQEGKDANEYLMKGLGKKFVDEWFRAPGYTPDHLKMGKDMYDEIVNRPKHFTVPYPWEALNSMTYGIRLSEAVLLMAETGIGKTSIFKELQHSLLTNKEAIENGYGVGFLHLEEPNYDTALGLMSIEKNKPFHLPDVERTDEELKDAFNKVLNNNRAVFYDAFGSNKVDEIVNKVRHMSALGCKYIFIDHLSIIVSDQSGDERKQLDEISTKLKTLTMELNIAVFCVIHTNRGGQVRGSAGPEQLANMHFSLHRDKKDPNPWRRNVTKIIIEKNRFCGRTGPCLWLWYNEVTGRMEELSKEQAENYEQGGNGVGLEMVF